MKLLCDAHSELMTEVSEGEETFLEMPGHPIHTLMEEHLHILRFMGGVRDSARSIRQEGGEGMGDKVTLAEIEPFLKEAQKHFQREENVLFPYMERHGMTDPAAVMWSEHEVLRAKERELLSLVARRRYMDPQEFASSLECFSSQLLSLLNAHFHRENHVLFPAVIRLLDIHEWNDVRKQFDEIGCCNFVPHYGTMAFGTVEVSSGERPSPGEIVLPTGKFTVEELEMVLNKLPVDFTFVDKDDRVRYYSASPDRVFVRTPAVVGRKVQNCHPQKSVQVVQGILDDFKSGARDVAEFWLQMGERFIHIRYFPLRDKDGNYQGVLEMVQDASHIRCLQGEKRLL